ncbi:MAG: T9SS type A sorting domain-containing protein, partial [Rhodocyclaceae bacterium]|nr:T9SS type A sorting domain-containing protein [Rhodocyclaceae bacterium]
GYRLDVSADNFATFVTGFSDKTVSGTSDAVTGLTANTAYKYRVRAVNAGGTSANSNVIDVTTLVNPPAASAATTITQTGFTANWNAVTGATGYRLDVSADNFATFVTGFSDKAVSGTSDAVTGLAANTAYKYRVRAVNANGTSANSNVIDVTTLAKQDQTITFAALPDRTIGDAAFTLSATASSALAVSFESLTTSKVTVSGNTVTMVAPGTATIRAKQDGNASFNAAPNVDRTFCIRPAKPTITLTNANTETPTLTSSATAGNQWFLNGTAITGATNATLTVTQAGVYTVRSTIETCASELSNAQAIIVTGDIASGTDALQVYPNPASDRVYVSLKSFARGSEVHLRLVDMNGRVLQKQIGQGGETVELSMAGYAGGAYLVTAEQGRLREQVKIVKE